MCWRRQLQSVPVTLSARLEMIRSAAVCATSVCQIVDREVVLTHVGRSFDTVGW